MATAMVCDRGPASRIASDSARADIRKMNSHPASRAGASNGATMRRSRVNCEAPQMAAASSSSRWICNMPDEL